MNPNYNRTITVYNKLPNSTAWQRTVLMGCSVKMGQTLVTNETKASFAGTRIVRIPESEAFLSPESWVAPGTTRTGKFTLQQGDLIVIGEIADTITGVSPSTMTEVLAKYATRAFKVSAFSDNTARPMSKHYRVGG